MDTKFAYMCRTCMRREQMHNEPLQLQSIYDYPLEALGAMSIAEVLTSTTPQLLINPLDGLPQLICMRCLVKLLEVQQFQEMCLSSEKNLRCIIEEGDALSSDAIVVEEATETLDSKYVLPEHDGATVQLTQTLAASGDTADDEELVEHVDDIIECIEIVEDPLLNAISVSTTEPIATDETSTKLPMSCVAEMSIKYDLHDYGNEIDVVDLDEQTEPSQLKCVLPMTKSNTEEDEDDNDEDDDDDDDDDDYDDDGDGDGDGDGDVNLNQPNTTKNLTEADVIVDELIQVDGDGSHEPERLQGKRKPPDDQQQLTPCPVCGKCFRGQYRLKRHLRVHDTNGRPYACNKCEYRFAQMGKLKAHETKLHNVENASVGGDSSTGSIPILSNDYTCDICNFVLANSIALTTHKAQHLANTGTAAATSLKYSCELCGKVFQTSQLLVQHKRTHRQLSVVAHISEYDDDSSELKATHLCRYCNKAFQQPRTLREHIRTHTGEQPYLCFECGKAFNSSSNMKQHLMRHTGELRYECPDCPKRFPCLSDLASHKAVHNKIKKHVCDLCGAAFVKPYQLKKHKMYHNGEKPHKCDYCDMRFVCANHMRRHMRTHTGEKPYKCKYCARAFAQSNDLIKHLRSHLGENVYKCELCPAAYRLACELRTHLTAHKNEDEVTRQRNLAALLEEEAKLKIKFSSVPAVNSANNGNKSKRVAVSGHTALDEVQQQQQQ